MPTGRRLGAGAARARVGVAASAADTAVHRIALQCVTLPCAESCSRSAILLMLDHLVLHKNSFRYACFVCVDTQILESVDAWLVFKGFGGQ